MDPQAQYSPSDTREKLLVYWRSRKLFWIVAGAACGVTLLIAALCAKGESVIESAQSIDRGYERVDEKLRNLGADITRED